MAGSEVVRTCYVSRASHKLIIQIDEMRQVTKFVVLYLPTLNKLDKIIDLAHIRIPHKVVEYELALPHSLSGYHHPTHHHHHHKVSYKKDGPKGHFVFGK